MPKRTVKFDFDLYADRMDEEITRLETLITSRPLTSEEKMKTKMFAEVFKLVSGIVTEAIESAAS
jgi:hypothetical protein